MIDPKINARAKPAHSEQPESLINAAINLFEYAGSDPIDRRDPCGTKPRPICECFLIFSGIVRGLGCDYVCYCAMGDGNPGIGAYAFSCEWGDKQYWTPCPRLVFVQMNPAQILVPADPCNGPQ